jgi:type II secretory pathway predicted ATPase ExeA
MSWTSLALPFAKFEGRSRTGPPYLGPGRDEAWTRLLRELLDGGVLLLIAGDAGVGKTTLLNAALDGVGLEAINVIRLTCAGDRPWDASEVARHLLSADATEPDVAGTLAKLALVTGDRQAVIVVDDAHHLSDDAMEFLLQIASPVRSAAPPRIVLCGTDAYWERDWRPELRLITTLAEQIRVEPLSEEQVSHYAAFRFGIATESLADIVETGALAEIARYGHGAISRIDQALEAAVAIARVRDASRLTGEIAEAATASLSALPSGDRKGRRAATVMEHNRGATEDEPTGLAAMKAAAQVAAGGSKEDFPPTQSLAAFAEKIKVNFDGSDDSYSTERSIEVPQTVVAFAGVLQERLPLADTSGVDALPAASKTEAFTLVSSDVIKTGAVSGLRAGTSHSGMHTDPRSIESSRAVGVKPVERLPIAADGLRLKLMSGRVRHPVWRTLGLAGVSALLAGILAAYFSTGVRDWLFRLFPVPDALAVSPRPSIEVARLPASPSEPISRAAPEELSIKDTPNNQRIVMATPPSGVALNNGSTVAAVPALRANADPAIPETSALRQIPDGKTEAAPAITGGDGLQGTGSEVRPTYVSPETTANVTALGTPIRPSEDARTRDRISGDPPAATSPSGSDEAAPANTGTSEIATATTEAAEATDGNPMARRDANASASPAIENHSDVVDATTSITSPNQDAVAGQELSARPAPRDDTSGSAIASAIEPAAATVRPAAPLGAAPPRTEPAPEQNTRGGVGASPPSVAASPRAATERTAELLRRGEDALRLGNVLAARLFFERAAALGSVPAATLTGKTYDPAWLATVDAPGLRSDSALAILWYRRAADSGDSEALVRLGALSRNVGRP